MSLIVCRLKRIAVEVFSTAGCSEAFLDFYADDLHLGRLVVIVFSFHCDCCSKSLPDTRLGKVVKRKKAWGLYRLPVPLIEALELPCMVERATQKPHANMYIYAHAYAHAHGCEMTYIST